jgi:amino acid permease
MKHKTIIQFIFGALFLIILCSFYFKYFSSNKQSSITQKTNDNSKSLEAKGNLIKDMKYENTDISGNKYFIYSEYGEVDVNNPDIILMKNVFAKVEIFKKDRIYINSCSAKYNLINYETNFNKDVELKYLDHVIFTENMDLSFQKNFAWLYTDVVYKSFDYELFADKIEIDLITKNSKIFTNNSKKVKIIKK